MDRQDVLRNGCPRTRQPQCRCHQHHADIGPQSGYRSLRARLSERLYSRLTGSPSPLCGRKPRLVQHEIRPDRRRGTRPHLSPFRRFPRRQRGSHPRGSGTCRLPARRPAMSGHLRRRLHALPVRLPGLDDRRHPAARLYRFRIRPTLSSPYPVLLCGVGTPADNPPQEHRAASGRHGTENLFPQAPR